MIAELSLSFLLGTLAMVNSLELSIAGRKPMSYRWPVIITLGWIAAMAAGFWVSSEPLGNLGDGTHCYLFIVLVGAPMAVVSIASLRSTLAIRPYRSLAEAGLASALISMTLLRLCHPVGVNLTDLSMHFAATVTLVLATVVLGKPLVSLR